MKHNSDVWGAVFSSDDSVILTWSDDGTARLWHRSSGVPVAPSMEHEDSVRGAVFSSDESLILTWSEDGTARLWHLSPLHQADEDFPAPSLPLLAEVLTGTIIDDDGNLIVLDAASWKARRDEYVEVAEKHLDVCRYPEANLYRRQKELWGLADSP